MSISWPLETVHVTGEWANSPDYYSQFGQRGHNGIDLAAPIGTPVYATDDGMIVAEGWGQFDNWMGTIAGIFVRIRHMWGYSAYAHLSDTVGGVGTWVKRGQLIGHTGATGVGTGPHLHFETFPLIPSFGNGFAGRVNPRIWGLVPFGSAESSPAPKPAITRRKNSMSTLYYTSSNDKRAGQGGTDLTWYLAGDSPGTPANWRKIDDQKLANDLAGAHGNAVFLSKATAHLWRLAYEKPLAIAK